MIVAIGGFCERGCVMARSESQGLQVAVILFTMLTVGLSFSTYLYFQSFTTEFEKRKTAENTAKEEKEKFEKQTFKVMSYQYLLGIGNITKPQLETLQERFGKDEELEAAMAEYEKSVAGHKINFTDTLKGYRALPSYFVNEVAARNNLVLDEKETVVKVNQEKEAIDKKKVEEVAAVEEAKVKAEETLNTKSQDFANYMAEHKKALDAVKQDLERKIAEVTAEKKSFTEQINKLTQTISSIEKERDKWRDMYIVKVEKVGPIYEAPDGEITWVNQRERIAWINVGFADGLARQTTFSVHDHDENGLTSHEPKARIEVLKILEPHMAECRILSDKPKNPILPGDKLFTPAWSPGQRLHFALAGIIDIDGDGRSDREEIKNIITLNGGVIDSEQLEDGRRVGDITHETRYLLRGKAPTEKDFPGSADTGKRAFQSYTEMVGSAEKKSVELIDVARFLSMMSWKAQEKTLAYGQKRLGPAGERKPRQAIEAGDEEPKPAKDDDKPAKAAKPEAEMSDDPFK
jgi:hypothetical protein